MKISYLGKEVELENGANVAAAVAAAGGSMAGALAASFNGRTIDLSTKLTEDGELKLLTFADEEGRAAYRHTASHVLAQAIKRIYPTVKLAIGPAISTGFYYDFDFKTPITQDDLEAVEAEMKKIIKANFPIERSVMPKDEAAKFMLARGEDYKVELISELSDDAEISFYKQGEFIDLCAGPHLTSTGKVK
ncbi:MAG: threonine--tRNA ligase, partial [Christensenellales bacterium]